MKNEMNSGRKLKYSSFGAVFILVFVAALVLVNVLASALQQRFPLSLDLTKDKAFTLSDISRQAIDTVENDVTIYVMQPENLFSSDSAGARMTQALRLYSQANPKIKVEYMDYSANPKFVQQYSDERIDKDSIIVQSAETHMILSITDLFTMKYNDAGQTEIVSDKIEQSLTAKIVAVSKNEIPSVAVVTGHNELPMIALQSLLESNGCTVATCDLTLSEIPDGTSVVVLSSPQQDYTAEEIAKLDRFLQNKEMNTSVMVLFSPQQGSLPRLETFLSEWGIQRLDGVLSETDPARHATDDATMAKVYLSPNEYTTKFGSEVAPLIYKSSAIKILFESKGDISVKPILQTAESAKNIVSDESGKTVSEEEGEFYPMVVSTSTRYIGQKARSSSVFAVGGVDFYTEYLLPRGNGVLTMSVINHLSGLSKEVYVPERPFDAQQMVLSQSQVVFVGLIVFTLAVPLAVLITGLYIWLRRRHL